MNYLVGIVMLLIGGRASAQLVGPDVLMRNSPSFIVDGEPAEMAKNKFAIKDGRLNYIRTDGVYGSVIPNFYIDTSKTHAIALDDKKLDGDPGGRLTEFHKVSDEIFTTSTITTFVRRGKNQPSLRAKTTCYGHLVNGVPSGELKCATASRQTCFGMNEVANALLKSKPPLTKDMAAINDNLRGKKTLKEATQECLSPTAANTDKCKSMALGMATFNAKAAEKVAGDNIFQDLMVADNGAHKEFISKAFQSAKIKFQTDSISDYRERTDRLKEYGPDANLEMVALADASDNCAPLSEGGELRFLIERPLPKRMATPAARPASATN